ncbi:MAG: hypothetical protein JW863_19960 [Chitinispirillaceae bacterium]|nr:hypothetical protein [Chitinispirillaceae bacterium]
MMKMLKTLLFISALSVAVSAQLDTNSEHYYMYSYFINLQQDAGARLAFSTDGITWHRYNNGDPVIVPIIAENEKPLMRDPNVYYDSATGVFHMVWTTAWKQDNIGYSSSKDLITWTEQVMLPVGRVIKGCACCWAPEFYYDDTRDSIMVFWSTERGTIGKEAFCCYTKDFKHYSAPRIYFHPRKNGSGDSTNTYTVIDETIVKLAENKYCLVFKDEREPGIAGKRSLNIHYIIGSTPSGPWQYAGVGSWDDVSSPITKNACEGPTTLLTGNELRVYFDPYGEGPSSTYRMVSINLSDFDYMNDPYNTPSPWTQGAVLKNETGADFSLSHGSIIEIPRAKALQIMNGIEDNGTYQPWTTITQNDITVDTIFVPEPDYPYGKQNCGCGTGVGLALFPPIAVRAFVSRRRKKRKNHKNI